MKNKIQITSVQNPFDRSNVVKTVLEYKRQTVFDIVEDYMPNLTCKFMVYINSELIEEQDWGTTFLLPEDQVFIIPCVGDSDVLQIVAMVALFVFAPQLAAAIPGTVTAAGTLNTFGQFLQAGIMLGGGMLISSLGPSPSTPSFGLGQDADISQFHSFNPSTKQRQGISVPQIFGKNKIYGNVIATHTELNEDNDKMILNTLIALGKGPIKGIVDFNPSSDFGEIKINGQPIDNFSNVIIAHRTGTLNQEIISFFDDTLVETIKDLTVSFGTPVIHTTSSGDFDELEIKIGSPGIFFQNDQNGLDIHEIGLKIEIAVASSGSYNTLFNGVIKDNRTATTKRVYRTIDSVIDIVNGNDYDIRVTKTTEDQTSLRYGDIIQFSSISTIITDDFIYPGIALVGIKALATDQLSGSLDFSAITEGSICRVWNGSAWVNEYSNNPAWVLYAILSIPIMSGESDGNYIIERFDGVNPNQLDTQAFLELADFCDELVPISEDNPSELEKRFTFNGGFDQNSSIWEAALTLCKMCRSSLIFNGTTISVISDKPTEVTQMFGMGNIIKGSFKENFPPQSERASEIEINFLDEEQDYNKTQFIIFNTSILNNSNKVNINLDGCTSKSQAWREGQFILKQNQYLLRSIEFQAGIDSLACQVGDVIEFAHDVPRWNQSGRVIAATSNTITMSEDFIDEDPSISENYKIIIRLSDDTLITKNILSFEDNIITVTSPFSVIPETDDIYQIGTSSDVNNRYRITQTIVNSDQNAQIRAIEYNPLIYSADDSGAELPTDATYSVDPDEALVTNTQLEEEVIISESGAIQRNITVSYELPESANFYQTLVYARASGVASFDLIGVSNVDKFTIPGVLENTDYEVKVITQLNNLKTSAFDNSPSGFITTGDPDEFENVLLTVIIDGLQIEGGSTTEWVGKDIAMIWDKLPIDGPAPANPSTEDYWDGIPRDFILDYEVKIYNFGGNIRRTEFVLEPRYTYTYENNFEDGSGNPSRNLRVEVKIRDKFGRVSETPSILTQIQNPVPGILSDVTDVELGTVSNISWTPSGEIDVINGGGYKLWASQSSPVDTSNDDDLIYRGPNTSYVFGPETDGVWFYKVAAYDSFDETISTPTQFSTTISSAQLTADFPIPSGIDFSTSGTNITWTAGTLIYKGTTYNISSGTTTGSNQYVYWDVDTSNTTFQNTNSLNTVIAADAWVMQHNNSGSPTPVNGFKIIHGGIIQADTITTNSLVVTDINALDLLNGPAQANADVTSSNTAANIAGQGSLATKSSVDLATGEITNKTADNIAETVSKFWAIEANADQTSGNTAANITGQGSLATQSSVDLSTVEVTNKTAANISETASLFWAGDWRQTADTTKIAGGQISTGTISANKISVTNLESLSADLGSIDAGSIKLSGLDGVGTTEALARYQMRMDGGGLQGRWRGSNLPAWSETESGSGADFNSGWREIIDITDNQVKLSFDSYNSGETINGIGSVGIAGTNVVFPGQATGWSKTITTRTGPVVLNATFFLSSDFTVEHVDQGPVTVSARVDNVTDSDQYECTLNMHDAGTDALIGTCLSNEKAINASDDNTDIEFTFDSVAQSFMNQGASLSQEIYVVVAMENVSVGTFSITFGDNLANEIKIDNVGLGAIIVKS